MNLGFVIGSKVAEAIREDPPKGFWNQVGKVAIEHVRVIVAEYDPVRFEVWNTMDDERACPICGQLDGVVWQDGEGFEPPVHDWCRCTRDYHHTEFRTRFVETWQQRTIVTQSWQWKVTY